MKLDKQMIKRLVMAFAGVALCGVTVGFFRITELGSDPFTVSTLGWARLFGTTYGTVYPFWTGLLLLIAFFLDRRRLGVATLINLFFTGFIGDATYTLFNRFAFLHTWPGRVGLMLLTLVLLCIASSLYFTADLGVSGYDAQAQMLAKYRKWPFRLCRIGTDVACVLFGFLCGLRWDVINIGTIVTALCMGPVVQFFIDHLSGPILAGTFFSRK